MITGQLLHWVASWGLIVSFLGMDSGPSEPTEENEAGFETGWGRESLLLLLQASRENEDCCLLVRTRRRKSGRY